MNSVRKIDSNLKYLKSSRSWLWLRNSLALRQTFHMHVFFLQNNMCYEKPIIQWKIENKCAASQSQPQNSTIIPKTKISWLAKLHTLCMRKERLLVNDNWWSTSKRNPWKINQFFPADYQLTYMCTFRNSQNCSNIAYHRYCTRPTHMIQWSFTAFVPSFSATHFQFPSGQEVGKRAYVFMEQYC